MKFKRGARVRVYDGWRTFDGVVQAVADGREQHVYVTEDGFFSTHSNSPFHPKQCRLLKPSPKKQGRALYALVPTYGVAHVKAYFDRNAADVHCNHAMERVVEYREVVKEKK